MTVPALSDQGRAVLEKLADGPLPWDQVGGEGLDELLDLKLAELQPAPIGGWRRVALTKAGQERADLNRKTR